MDPYEAAALVTARLPARIGTHIGYRLGERASRRTRYARLATGGRVAADIGDHLHRNMFFRGRYEESVTNYFRRHAFPGWTVLDVGANVGYFAVVAADLGGPTARVVAFEPDPRLGAMLQRTADANPKRNIMVERSAVGRHNGTAMFTRSVDDLNSGLGTLLEGSSDSSVQMPVGVVRLDDFCAKHGLRPDVVKIDVEGFERQVLEGLGAVLTDRVPQAFVIEVAPQREDPALVIDHMDEHGYSAHQVNDDGSLRPVTDVRFAYDDLVFERRK